MSCWWLTRSITLWPTPSLPRRRLRFTPGRSSRWFQSAHFRKSYHPGCGWAGYRHMKRSSARLAGSGLLDSGGGMNPFTSALLRSLVESGGLEQNITALRREYALRRRGDGRGLSASTCPSAAGTFRRVVSSSGCACRESIRPNCAARPTNSRSTSARDLFFPAAKDWKTGCA